MTRKFVTIGGTFACDEALAVPLRYLLLNAGVDVDLQWLQYGSLTSADTWSSDVLHPVRPVDLVLLLVRLSDLEVPHPELHFSMAKEGETSTNISGDGVTDSAVNRFLCELERYDKTNSNSASAPLVVLLCPCPPPGAARFNAMEGEIQSKTEAMKKVSVVSSDRVLALFQQQYTSVFYDAVADKRQHSPYTQPMLNVLSLSLCRQICRLFRSASNRKKVLVLDCDNTLWGGAIAEVGASGIELAPRFLALQRFVVAQEERGMLLTLCSKNILVDVIEAFTQRQGEMILNMDKHVAAVKINWQPKSVNIAELAKELSLGLDSFIFIDDNPLECHEVATALPSVTVISLGADFSETLLENEWVFDDGLSATSHRQGTSMEDEQRTLLYQQNLERQRHYESSATHKAFLSTLGVKIVFEELDHGKELGKRSSSFTRVLQLHHRTNQFNTATTFVKRLEEEALLEYVTALDHTVVCAHVMDRFGHYGLVSVALCQHLRDSNVLRVDSFLLSCRALNRGVEHAMVRRLGEIAAKAGATSIEFSWEPTERNQPAHVFFLALCAMKFVSQNDHSHKASLRSSAVSGTWVITLDKVSKVSFLKSEDSPYRNSVTMSRVIGRLLRLRCVQWLQKLAFSVIKWTLSSAALPLRWIARVFKPCLVQRLGELGFIGSLRVPLRERGSLEKFLHPVLHDIAHVNGHDIPDDSSVDANDDKFRRKARHQTKMALVNYTHEDVIWSANRPYVDNRAEVGDDDTVFDSASGSTFKLQLICASPRCSSTIQRDSQCVFQRCRTCCYRIQRLLTRSLHHEHGEARQSAHNELRIEFTGEVANSSRQTCKAHQNTRRRGEMYKLKPSEKSP